MKYEVKGIDEEMKGTLNIEKKLDKMDEDGIDFDDDDEEIEVSEPGKTNRRETKTLNFN